MSDPFQTPASPFTTTRAQTQVDAGLRSYMNSIYNRMTLGLAITFGVAYVASNSMSFIGLLAAQPWIALVLAFSPVAVVWFGFNPARMASKQLMASFMLISVLYGLSFSTIFLMYPVADIARALLITTIMFAGLSIYGYVTKRDLGPVGTFCVMGMFGLLALSVLYMLGAAFSLVEPSPMMNNLISVITIIVFAGMTAFDTQNAKQMYNASYTPEGNSRLAWACALNLYISFIALFQSILQLLSNRE